MEQTAPTIDQFHSRSEYYMALDRHYAGMYGVDDNPEHQEGMSHGSESHRLAS